MQGIPKTIIPFFLCLFMTSIETVAADVSHDSIHLGLMYPSGVDVVGYTVEQPLSAKVYRFYTFGVPSLAAIGINYYDDYQGNGFTGTLGVGIGSVLYGSLAYQLRLVEMQYVKIGAGLTTSIVYTGVYPVFSYEYRF